MPDAVGEALRADPLPPDADYDAVEAWIERYLDQSASNQAEEAERHAR